MQGASSRYVGGSANPVILRACDFFAGGPHRAPLLRVVGQA
jgi:hypothetical protein